MASTHSDQGLQCPLTELLNTTEFFGLRTKDWMIAHAQDDVNLQFTHVRRHFFTICILYTGDQSVILRYVIRTFEFLQVIFVVSMFPPDEWRRLWPIQKVSHFEHRTLF